MRLFLSLGSNLGDRRANIEKAIGELEKGIGAKALKRASIRETEPWGFESKEMFLNTAVEFDTEMDPYELLALCKSIEARLGRKDTPTTDEEGRRVYCSRPIDIDIIVYGNLMVDSDTLKIPHPLMWEREFVMEPLREMEPGIFGENI